MKVVILAGGYGTRFGKLTDFLPKPMIPIGPFPIIWHIMRIYAHYGFNDFIVCTGYKSEMFKDFFSNMDIYTNDYTIDFSNSDGPGRLLHRSISTFRPRITIAYTGQETMTGGRIKRISHYLGNDSDFMLTYGDGVSDIDIDDLIRFHNYHGKIATLTAVYPPPKFGDLGIAGNQVTSFTEKKGEQGAMVNGGFYVFKKEILDYLDDSSQCVLEKGPLETLAREGQLMSYRHNRYWQCMDTTRDLESLQKAWSQRRAPWKIWTDDYQD